MGEAAVEVQVFKAGYGFYERLLVRPIRAEQGGEKVVCRVIEGSSGTDDDEITVDLTDSLSESEFWPESAWDATVLREWAEAQQQGTQEKP